MGVSAPPPNPFAARELARLLLGRGTQRPLIALTLLEGPGSDGATLEIVNEGGPADGLTCLARSSVGMQELPVGNLGPGESESVRVEQPPDGAFECVWACSDSRGRTHVGSYDGRHRSLRRRERLDLEAVFRELYR